MITETLINSNSYIYKVSNFKEPQIFSKSHKYCSRKQFICLIHNLLQNKSEILQCGSLKINLLSFAFLYRLLFVRNIFYILLFLTFIVFKQIKMESKKLTYQLISHCQNLSVSCHRNLLIPTVLNIPLYLYVAH